MGGYRLGVDFGTSNTVAVLSWPAGQVRPLLFDGSPLLPSAVYAQSVDELLVGRDAIHAARAVPGSFEPHPKRRVDEGIVLLGQAEVPVADLFAAVFGRIVAEVDRVAEARPAAVVLTHPASWGPRRRELLASSAAAAGMGRVRLVPEPVAAAAYLVEVARARLPVGARAVVYDFGAGTFDATVVRRTDDGFEVLATRGLDDTGGLDIDAAIVAYLGAVYRARDPDVWRRLTEPATPADRRAAGQLWEDVRASKEALSRLGSTLIHLPILDEDAPLGREQLEQIARPVVDHTIAATQAAVREAGLDLTDLAGVFLVGGASRLPLAATMLHRNLGLAAFITEQPELVVAEGSLHARFTRPEPPTAPQPAIDPLPPQEAPAKTATTPSTAVPPKTAATRGATVTRLRAAARRTIIGQPRMRARRRLVLAAVTVAVVIVVAFLAVVIPGDDPPEDLSGTISPPAGGAGDSAITLGFVQAGAGSDWRAANTRSIQDAARAAGIELKVSDGNFNQQTQIEAIRAYIAQKMDVIAFSPVVEPGWDTVLKQAKDAGIPVILTDRAVDAKDTSLYRTLLGSDFVLEGRKAGEWLVGTYAGRSDPVTIVELRGTAGSVPANERKQGFDEVVATEGKFKIIASPVGDFTRAKGKDVMAAFIRTNRNIQVLYAHNDDMGLGAIEAIEAAGLTPGTDIQIITIDAVKDGMTALAAGKINFIVECSPLLGPQLMDLVRKVHTGQQIPARVRTEETTFDQDQARAALTSRQYRPRPASRPLRQPWATFA